jgi:hypothetical protein
MAFDAVMGIFGLDPDTYRGRPLTAVIAFNWLDPEGRDLLGVRTVGATTLTSTLGLASWASQALGIAVLDED